MNRKTVYFVLFAVSGFSGLMYESVWSHYLKLFLGHAAYAQTLVLMIYMGGLALGSFAASRVGIRIRNLLLAYALCEAGIGILAMAFHPGFVSAMGFSYDTVIPRVHGEYGLNLYKWLISSLLILPQTVLLGATFPFMSAGLIRKFPHKPGQTLAVLYFANSCGGAVGVLVCGYYFIGAAGYPGAIAIAGGLNIALACAVWSLTRRSGAEPGECTGKTEPALSHESRNDLRVFLIISACTGASSFMYEIGWIRMLGIVLGSYTHSFELMLSAFVLGLALGSLFIRWNIDAFADRPVVLGVVQVAMGVSALATIVFYNGTFDMMRAMLNAIGGSQARFVLLQMSSQAIAYLVMLPATICAGMTLPLITFHLLKKGCGERAIGAVYAANTVGAIIGVAVGVQLILPVLGLKNLIVCGGGIDLVIGLYLMYRGNKKAWIGLAAAGGAVLAFCVFCVSFDTSKMSSQVFTEAPWVKENDVLFHKDGKTATVDVVRYARDNAKGICTNGMNVGTIGNGPNVITQNATLLAALPLGMMKNPRDVATFGVGTGYNARVFLSDTGIRSVDIIEIEKQMYEGAKYIGDWVSQEYNDPRCHRYVEDARSFFAWKNKKYDIVVADISYVWVSGVSCLFSREFYGMIRGHISKDGLFVQWMHTTSMPLLGSIIKALSLTFRDYSIYYAGNFLIIVAGNDASFERLDNFLFALHGPDRFLRENSINSLADMRLHYLGGARSLGPLFNSYALRPNSDYYPVLDLLAFKTAMMGQGDCFQKLFDLRSMRLPLIAILENGKGTPRPGLPTTDMSLARAERIHGFCVSNGDARQVADTADLSLLSVLGSLGNKNGGSAEETIRWIVALNEVMKVCLPVLSAGEMDDIIKYVKTKTGAVQGLPDVTLAVSLYDAINKRDFKTCYDISMHYLSSSGGVAIHETFFLPLAMVSAIRRGRPQEALELWKRYENKADPAVPVRLLHQLALQELGAPIREQ